MDYVLLGISLPHYGSSKLAGWLDGRLVSWLAGCLAGNQVMKLRGCTGQVHLISASGGLWVVGAGQWEVAKGAR